MKHYTYLHRRVDTNEVFYIGKGQDRRAWIKSGRNRFWKSIVKDSGDRVVEIIAHWDTEKQAHDHEVFLIWCFKQLGITLCNITDGGEGSSGFKKGAMSEEHKQKIREGTRKRWQDPEHKKNQSKARKGRKSWSKGLTLSEEHKKKVSEGHKRRVLTPEDRLKKSLAKKGKPAWNKGLTYTRKNTK